MELNLLTEEDIATSRWEDLDIVIDGAQPFMGDVRLKIRPRTRELGQEARILAKRDPVYRRHRGPDGNMVDGNEDEAFLRALGDLVIEEWDGVKFRGEVAECIKENKVRFLSSLELADWVVKRSGEIALRLLESETKNSPT